MSIPPDLPPLAAEDHRCLDCGLYFPEITVDKAVEVIRGVPEDLRAAVAGVPTQLRSRRPAEHVWSVAEYVCHIRDVYITYTIRLYRTRTEDRPALEPMLNDLRATRFRYHEYNIERVLAELGATVNGFCAEIAHTGETDWDRRATRLPTEPRTARWLVRQAMHEGVHHIGDVRAVGIRLGYIGGHDS